MKRMVPAALAALIVLGLSGQAGAQDMGDPKKGAELAQMVCAECHAVGNTRNPSPNAQAPSFASVATAPGMTPTALRVWFQTPHPTMPNLLLTNDAKDNLIAYILSLKRP